MPQKDILHDAVRKALIKDGWTITHDPLILRYSQRNVFVDLGAEAPIAAEKAGRKIAVEIKSFMGVSEITDLERALGQYALYRFLLKRREPDRSLFLAIARDAYATVFAGTDGQDLMVEQELKVLVFDAIEEAVVEWRE